MQLWEIFPISGLFKSPCPFNLYWMHFSISALECVHDHCVLLLNVFVCGLLGVKLRN